MCDITSYNMINLPYLFVYKLKNNVPKIYHKVGVRLIHERAIYTLDSFASGFNACEQLARTMLGRMCVCVHCTHNINAKKARLDSKHVRVFILDIVVCKQKCL